MAKIGLTKLGLNLRFSSKDENGKLGEIRLGYGQNKTDIELQLPLIPQVGNAIYEYIANERPKSQNANLFLRQDANVTADKIPSKRCRYCLLHLIMFGTAAFRKFYGIFQILPMSPLTFEGSFRELMFSPPCGRTTCRFQQAV